MILINDHISLLVKATEEMSAEEQLDFYKAFSGALIFSVSRKLWLQAISIGEEIVNTTPPPGPPQQAVMYDPALIKILKKRMSFKETIKGNARTRKQLREALLHGGSTTRIRVEKKGGK